MAQSRKILVTGATGQQGGAVVRHLQQATKQQWGLRALTRNAAGEAARKLAASGVEIVEGDMLDRAAMDRAVAGVYGVFSVQNTWTAGPEDEVREGKLLADAAAAARVQHLVYTSVGGAERKTGIPHFETKWEIEQYLAKLGLPVTVVRPVFFMENLLAPNLFDPVKNEGRLVFSLRPDIKLQMIAVADIGAFVAMAFGDPEKFLGEAYELAGDELVFPEVARRFAVALGREVEYVEISFEEMAKLSEEYAIMVRWFNDYGYEADIAGLREMYPPLQNLDQWMKAQGLVKELG